MELFYCQKYVKRKPAGVAELVDAQDLKSCGGNPVPVRFRPSAPSHFYPPPLKMAKRNKIMDEGLPRGLYIIGLNAFFFLG
jgi:hypothetical protein